MKHFSSFSEKKLLSVELKATKVIILRFETTINDHTHCFSFVCALGALPLIVSHQK